MRHGNFQEFQKARHSSERWNPVPCFQGRKALDPGIRRDDELEVEVSTALTAFVGVGDSQSMSLKPEE